MLADVVIRTTDTAQRSPIGYGIAILAAILVLFVLVPAVVAYRSR